MRRVRNRSGSPRSNWNARHGAASREAGARQMTRGGRGAYKHPGSMRFRSVGGFHSLDLLSPFASDRHQHSKDAKTIGSRKSFRHDRQTTFSRSSMENGIIAGRHGDLSVDRTIPCRVKRSPAADGHPCSLTANFGASMVHALEVALRGQCSIAAVAGPWRGAESSREPMCSCVLAPATALPRPAWPSPCARR